MAKKLLSRSSIVSTFCGSELKCHCRRGSLVESHLGRRSNFATAAAKPANDIRPFESIPGPKGLPLIGVAHKAGKGGEFDFTQGYRVARELHEKYGPILKMNYGFGNILVMLSDPADYEIVIRADGPTPKRRVLHSVEKHRAMRNIPVGLVGQGEDWKRARQAVQQEMLRPQIVSSYLPEQSRVADDLVRATRRSMDENNEIEQYLDLVKAYAFEALGVVTYDRRFGVLSGEKLEPKFERLSNLMSELLNKVTMVEMFWQWHKFGLSRRWRQIKNMYDALRSSQVELHRETMEQIEKNVTGLVANEENFLRRMMSNPDLTPEDVSVNMQDLLVAGIDTTAYSIAFALMDLGRNPDIQEKLYTHIREVMGDRTEVTSGDLEKLRYLKGFVKESMRLLPITRALLRYPPTDLVIKKYLIPADTMVLFSLYVNHMDPKYFPEPEKFIPERWMRDGDTKTVPFTYLPFGHGVRGCIGQRFSLQEMYLSLIKLLSNFRIEPMVDSLEILTYHLPAPTKPLHLKFIERNI